MKIGVVIAMEKEYRLIKETLGDAREVEINGIKFTEGSAGSNEIILTMCGIGKVNAAIGAVEMIGSFKPDAIISSGVAGGASADLEVQDVVVSSETAYHDLYCGKESAYGQVPGMPEIFVCDKELLGKALAIDCGTRIKDGLIVTGDWFVDSKEKMGNILDHFPKAKAVDMESSAIAQVCYKYNVRFLSFRIISDIPLKDNKGEMYFNFWDTVANKSFSVTKAFLESL